MFLDISYIWNVKDFEVVMKREKMLKRRMELLSESEKKY